MSAPTNYIAYYASSPEILYEYNWQQTFGTMFREFFIHFPFHFSGYLELHITEERAYNLPIFTFWDFSLWDKFLWLINFSIVCIVVGGIIWLIVKIIKLIFRGLKHIGNRFIRFLFHWLENLLRRK